MTITRPGVKSSPSGEWVPQSGGLRVMSGPSQGAKFFAWPNLMGRSSGGIWPLECKSCDSASELDENHAPEETSHGKEKSEEGEETGRREELARSPYQEKHHRRQQLGIAGSAV